jgi:hypothetical protein
VPQLGNGLRGLATIPVAGNIYYEGPGLASGKSGRERVQFAASRNIFAHRGICSKSIASKVITEDWQMSHGCAKFGLCDAALQPCAGRASGLDTIAASLLGAVERFICGLNDLLRCLRVGGLCNAHADGD